MVIDVDKDIKKIFWSNVDWHRENKGLPWVTVVGGNSSAAKKGVANVTLNKVQEIAEILDIDDYAILFEVSEE